MIGQRTIGQRHYLIARDLPDGRTQFWRSKRGLERGHDGWTFNILEARSYKRPHDALRAARQLSEETSVEVVECESVIARVAYRVHIEAVSEEK